MKIALITNMTPAADNVRGTSALPFHLLVHRPTDVEVDVYSLDYHLLSPEMIKETEERLNVKVIILPRPKLIDWFLKYKVGLLCRLFMRYPIHNYARLTESQVAEIKSKGYGGIWIYGEEMSRVSKQFSSYNRCHLLPDCTSMFFYRMMGRRFVVSSFSKLLKNFLFYRKFVRMEYEFDTADNIKYLLVGEEDTNFLRNISPQINASFLRHPHYDVSSYSDISFESGRKIRLLIAGRNDYYMQLDTELAVQALCENNDLANNYEITFLGKGWERLVKELLSAGYEVHHIAFAPDYKSEICKHDIQLTSICIGTGTKGKVLDALANGLLVIGSSYAFENIAVSDGESCLMYDSPQQIVDILKKIASASHRYIDIAVAGREAVLREHSRAKISEQFFDLFR